MLEKELARLHETKRLLHNKRKSQLFKEEAHRMGEKLFQLYICKGFIIRICRKLRKQNSQQHNDPKKKRGKNIPETG
jgi:hypothetical protein